jgi:ParB family chromosome partitioning protein
MEKKPRLGRGLDALLGTPEEELVAAGARAEVSLEAIEQNPYQPRKEFDEDALASLRDSIKNHGILQPLVVRPVGDHYQLIAGERRLRAARAAGLSAVPVSVVDFNDQQVLEAALAENIQRADLNPIEKAQGFKDYLVRYDVTHDQLAARLGLSRATISHLVALLEMPPDVQQAIRMGQLTMAHAKVLKNVGNPERQSTLAKEIIGRGLSVKQVETIIKEPVSPPKPTARPSYRTVPEKTAHVQAIEDELRQKLGVRFEIRLRDADKGQFVLSFESNDDFERLVEVLRK